MRGWTGSLLAAGLVLSGMVWVGAADYPGTPPSGDYQPRHSPDWSLTGPEADDLRLDAFRRAVYELPAADAARVDETIAPLREELSAPLPVCRFVLSHPSGTSAKFDCVMRGGMVVKVKYGRNPEINAEAAATRLLHMLGYAADTVAIVPRLRCYGCPRFPFIATHLHTMLRLPIVDDDGDEGWYTDFQWVLVERKFPAPPIETDSQSGWSWWELDQSLAPRAELDALRLTAMFLAHWDNKSENQRLVCLDGTPPATNARCMRPLGMIQDLGASFGPMKVNLARWHSLPVWRDRAACILNTRALPLGGATFPETRISEEGRARLAARLAAITDEQIERLFAEARFPEFQVGTDEEKDLKAWVAAFRHRAQQIVDARCTD